MVLERIANPSIGESRFLSSSLSRTAKFVELTMIFNIDEQYICDVTVRTETSTLENPDNPTDEDLIKMIKGHHKIVSISNKDHDEFTRLRDKLEELGYIETQRGWWNGDRVLKPFYLNGWRFKKNHKFPCAAALKVSIECARKHGWKSISSL